MHKKNEYFLFLSSDYEKEFVLGVFEGGIGTPQQTPPEYLNSDFVNSLKMRSFEESLYIFLKFQF